MVTIRSSPAPSYFSPAGSLTAIATITASPSSSTLTVANPALSENRANIAVPIGPTMNVIAWALLPMPKAVPRYLHALRECRVTYWRSTPSIRDCQPSPVDLKYARTSGL